MAEIVAEYRINVDKTVAELRRVADATEKTEAALDEAGKSGKKAFDDTGKAADKASTEVKKVEQSSGGVTSALKKVGAAMLAAFAVDRLVAFGREAVNLAAKAEGVERAFKRIGSPELLAGLRAATRGTVSDLILMQNAVKASNFKIPLDQLGSLLQFAQSRARETGESVDYLVDSIINGIGRKSPLILDNLGISAVALRDKLNGVSTEAASIGDVANAVGEIARDALNEIGVQADTTADKIAQLATVWENFKTDVGGTIVNTLSAMAVESGLISADSEATANFMDRMSNTSLPKLLELMTELRKESENLAGLSRRDLTAEQRKQQLIQQEFIRLLDEEIEKRKEQAQTINEVEYFTQQQIEAELKRLAAIEAEKDAQKERIRNVYFLKAAIKTLNEELNAEGTSRERIRAILQEVKPLEKELAELLADEARALERIAMTSMASRGGVVQVGETLESLNRQLKAAQDAKTKAFEFSDEFMKAEADIARLEERIRQFGDNTIAVGAKVSSTVTDDVAASTEEMAKANQNALDIMQAGLSTLSNIYASVAQMAQQTTQYELQLLRDQFEDGIITREEYYAKERELQRESAQRAKDAATFQAIIGAAQAALNALSTPGVPFPVALAFSLFAAAQAAVQVATIQSAPLPRFEDGGVIKGKRHYQGGEVIEAEAGEYVINRSATAKNMALIEAINKGVADAYIMRNWVAPAVDAALLNGWQDVGKSAELNGITANLKDHNIIAAMDRNRQATTYGLKMLADEIKANKRRGDRNTWH